MQRKCSCLFALPKKVPGEGVERCTIFLIGLIVVPSLPTSTPQRSCVYLCSFVFLFLLSVLHAHSSAGVSNRLPDGSVDKRHELA